MTTEDRTRSHIPRIGDILEDGAGRRSLVVEEGPVDHQYTVCDDDPTRCVFRDETVRIVGSIADRLPARRSPADE